MNEPATHVACLTPAGAGAIAVLAVYGPRAWPALREVFRPAGRPLPAAPAAGAVWFGHVGEPGSADEVVMTVKQTDPLPWLELQCHGGSQASAWITELLTQRGLVRCSWPRFLARAQRRGEFPALTALARAPTVRTAAILLDQVNGALAAAVACARQAGDPAAAVRGIDEILRFESLGMHLTEPWRVVVAGPPNVGKSSLVNALAGFPRSIVTPVAGTTRDIVATSLAFDGWPVELLDTAGLRDAAGGVEGEGIGRARAVLRSADLVLWLLDATAAAPAGPDDDARSAPRLIVVANKCDLSEARPQSADLRISARTGAGIPELADAISRSLVPDPPPAGAAVPFRRSQIRMLRRLRADRLKSPGGRLP